MTKFKRLKREFETVLLPPAWPEDAEGVPAGAFVCRGMEAVSPLLALLPRGGLLKWRAVLVLGRVVADIAASDMDDARTVMRRCMWHMNEDSGNMGWGIAEAMGETAALSAPLAGEYGRVILSYARDTGFADNYIDHAVLRRGTYWAIGRFAPVYPAYRAEGAELLLNGLADEDAQSRGIAAWGLGKLAAAGTFTDDDARTMVVERLERLDCLDCADRMSRADRVDGRDICEVLDGTRLRAEPAAGFVRQTLSLISRFRPN